MVNSLGNIPVIGQASTFTFKEPFLKVIQTKFSITEEAIRLTPISVISMRDLIRTTKRDPYAEVYSPAGISEVEWKKDLIDEVPLISFIYTDIAGGEHIFRIPLNYIETVSKKASIEYTNRVFVINLGNLPSTLQLDSIYSDVCDFVETRVGVKPTLKDVTTGEPETVCVGEYETRETIRVNSVTVKKTLSVMLEEERLQKTDILRRLREMETSLGG